MTKQEKIDKYLKEPLKVGDKIYVQGLGSQNKKSWFSTAKVTKIEGDNIYINEYNRDRLVTEDWKKYTGNIGNNPFPDRKDSIQNINYQLESILFTLFKEDKYDIKSSVINSSNFNPFVFVGGKKEYYQRPFVWNVEDKQLLIESIYNGVDCGKILIRSRGWAELGELQKDGHELAWKDIVDGKQRLNAIQGFLDDEFKDLNGNYYSDLSDTAQRMLCSHQLFSYSELPENTSDEEVLRQFLRLNFAGVPQSKEHIEFVKDLLK